MKVTKCYECGQGKLQKKLVPYVRYGVHLGKFSAQVCGKCDEEFYDGQTFDKIEQAAKKAGVWGLSMKTKVGKNGNSLDVRISHRLAQFVGLQKGKEVIIRPEGKNRLIVEVQ
jgi:ribosomal protein L32